MQYIKIQGALPLTSHLHVSSTVSARLTDEGFKNFSSDVGKPLTAQMSFKAFDKVGNLVRHIPFLPGNGLRGRLRRYGSKYIFKKFEELHGNSKDQKFTIESFHGMTSGAVTGSPLNSSGLIKQIQKERDHVFLGLFGGGPTLTRSAYMVSDLIPICGLTKQLKMVGTDLEVGIAEHDNASHGDTTEGLTGFYHIFRRDDLLDGKYQEFEGQISNFEHDGQTWLTTVAKADGGRSKEAISNMVAVEAIVPGVNMWFELRLEKNVLPEQFGLMLQSLRELVNDNRLGGWTRAGFGRFDPSHLKLIINNEEIPLFPTKKGDQWEFYDHEIITNALAALDKKLSEVDYDYFNSMFDQKALSEALTGKKPKAKKGEENE